MEAHRWTVWLVLAALIGPQVARAVEVEFVFTAIVSGGGPGVDPAIPGVFFGDTHTLRVVADNGNDTLINQRWDREDVVGIPTVDVGTYHADYIPLNDCLPPCFSTAQFGETLVDASFTDNNGNNEDSFGASSLVTLSLNAITDSAGRLAFLVPSSDRETNWTVTIVPEPSPHLLGAFGLATLALLAQVRRRGCGAHRATSR
jgi:hypothetical protein